MTRNLLNEYEVYAIQKARRRSSRRRVVEWVLAVYWLK